MQDMQEKSYLQWLADETPTRWWHDSGDPEELAAGLVRTRENLSWKEWGTRVNDYLIEMNKLVSPDLIIIGGGVSENFDLFKDYLTVDTCVVPARMTNDAGIIGAALAVNLPYRKQS